MMKDGSPFPTARSSPAGPRSVKLGPPGGPKKSAYRRSSFEATRSNVRVGAAFTPAINERKSWESRSDSWPGWWEQLEHGQQRKKRRTKNSRHQMLELLCLEFFVRHFFRCCPCQTCSNCPGGSMVVGRIYSVPTACSHGLVGARIALPGRAFVT